ncbi:MAG: aldo/keto reductase [Magnetococcus sp. MYC-9]
MNRDNWILSACGVEMPQILYGTAWKQERTALLVEKAIAQGFRGIDTACQPKHYDEAGVGAGVAAALQRGLQRADLYLQTKFTSLNGQDPARLPYDPRAPLSEQVAQSFQRSLANLQTHYLDCLVLHAPMATPAQTLEVWRALERIVEQGGVRQLGISNCYDLQQLEHLYQSATIKPAVLQNRFYAATRYDQAIRLYCRQQQILYQSFWTLTANPALLAHPTLQSLARTHHCQPEPLFFRYLTQIGIIPLTGTTSTAHMQEDLAIFAWELTAEECQALGSLL